MSGHLSGFYNAPIPRTDARLVAELVEALRETLESHQREDPHHEDLCPVCRKASAAIAKATGVTP